MVELTFSFSNVISFPPVEKKNQLIKVCNCLNNVNTDCGQKEIFWCFQCQRLGCKTVYGAAKPQRRGNAATWSPHQGHSFLSSPFFDQRSFHGGQTFVTVHGQRVCGCEKTPRLTMRLIQSGHLLCVDSAQPNLLLLLDSNVRFVLELVCPIIEVLGASE